MLKKHRAQKDWSQMELAAKAGIHLNALGNIERGESVPNIETIFALCRALDVSVADFFRTVEWWIEKDHKL